MYARSRPHAEAQDIAQEAFVRAFDRWAVISAYDDPVAWVRRVAWNLATSLAVVLHYLASMPTAEIAARSRWACGVPDPQTCRHRLLASADGGRTCRQAGFPRVSGTDTVDVAPMDANTVVVYAAGQGIWLTMDGLQPGRGQDLAAGCCSTTAAGWSRTLMGTGQGRERQWTLVIY